MDQNQNDADCCFQRIGPSHLRNFINKKVSIVVVASPSREREGIVLFKMDEKTTIEVENLDIQEPQKQILLEVRGTLVSEDKISCDQVTELSENFDIPTYYKVVNLMQGKFRELFYE